MSSPLPPAGPGFIEIARRLALLDAGAAEVLAVESAGRNISPGQLALAKGMLDAVDVDIVETLLRPHEVIPGYEVFDLIGKGGMGVVYRARQKNLNRVVALKTVLISRMAQRGSALRFEQEAMLVGRLRHPNIVAAHDFGRHEGRLYFAMELVDGEDADSFVRRNGRLREAAAWGLARQAAAGLSHAAREGVVHRDIKPANLLLVEPPEGYALPPGLPMVKIADFGLAFLNREAPLETRITSEDATVGSPHYIAPEQLSASSVDLRADIYALGASVFHLLAGRPPYAGASVPQIVAQKVSAPPPSLADHAPGVSRDSIDLTRNMMARNPDERIADYSTLLRRIDAVLGSLDLADPSTVTDLKPATRGGSADATRHISAEATTPTRRVRRPARLSWTVAVALASALALAGWWLIGGPGAADAGTRDLVETGWSDTLFTGDELTGWLHGQTGLWKADRDDEGALVLSGTDGTARRRLMRYDGARPRPLEHFRLSLMANLQDAHSVEIEFGIADHGPDGGPRHVLRLSQAGATLGIRQGHAAAFVASIPTRTLPNGVRGRHVVHIERHSRGWWVFLEEELLGAAPAVEQQGLPEFRLRVEGGPAWVSDVIVEELGRRGD